MTAATDGNKKALHLKGKSDDGVKKQQQEDSEDPGYTIAKKSQRNLPEGAKKTAKLKGESDNGTKGNSSDGGNDPGYTIKDKDPANATESNTSVKKLATDLPKAKRDPRDGIPVADYLSSNYGEKSKPGEDAGDDNEETTKKNGAGNDAGSGGGGGGATSTASPKKKSGIEGGIKLGYERGLQGFTSAKEVVEIFAQFNISKKVVLMIQPTIKFAKTNKPFDFEGGFYNVTSNSHVAVPDSPFQSTHTYTHTYKQSYDSFYVKRSYEQKYQEFDIPLIFKYVVDKNLALFAGLNISIGKILKVKEEVTPTISYNRNFTNIDSLNIGLPFDMVFAPHTGSPISAYNSADYQNATTNPLRFGYLLGLSYELKQRFLFDLMIQQNMSGQTNIPNKDIRSIYAQPYIRFSIGYKLFGNRKETE